MNYLDNKRKGFKKFFKTLPPLPYKDKGTIKTIKLVADASYGAGYIQGLRDSLK